MQSIHAETRASDSTVTVVVRNLPIALTGKAELVERFFSHFGAIPNSTRPMSSARMQGTCFVDFPDRVKATQALTRLICLRGENGKRIRVDYATLKPEDIKATRMPIEHPQTVVSAEQPLAPHLGFSYPLNPDLHYAYPRPNSSTLLHMMQSIAEYPRLYVQVLHLMNKMGCAVPFVDESDKTASIRAAQDKQWIDDLLRSHTAQSEHSSDPGRNLPLKRTRDNLVASDESEIESDNEHLRVNGSNNIANRKSPHVQETFPSADQQVTVDGYGKPHDSKKFKPDSQDQPPSIATESVQCPFNTEEIALQATPSLPDEATWPMPGDLAGAKAIDQCKTLFLEPDAIKAMIAQSDVPPPPKSYASIEAIPSTTLYLKNLHPKQTTEADIANVFACFWIPTLAEELDTSQIQGTANRDKIFEHLQIRLMRTGRMKGQAFVQMPTLEAAIRARNIAQHFPMHGKPMVIDFGKQGRQSNAV